MMRPLGRSESSREQALRKPPRPEVVSARKALRPAAARSASADVRSEPRATSHAQSSERKYSDSRAPEALRPAAARSASADVRSEPRATSYVQNYERKSPRPEATSARESRATEALRPAAARSASADELSETRTASRELVVKHGVRTQYRRAQRVEQNSAVFRRCVFKFVSPAACSTCAPGAQDCAYPKR